MQRLLGFVFILILISTLTTSVQALQAAPECLEQADCGEGLACDMEINQCVADDDGESGDGAPAECGDPCEAGFVCDWDTGACVEDQDDVPVTECWSDEDCMDGYWCNTEWEADTADDTEDTGESEAQGVPLAPEESGDEDADAEPTEETGRETEGAVEPPSGYCASIDDETGGGETGLETADGEESGAGTSADGETGDGDSSDSGGCSVTSSGDVDRGLVLLLALAAAFALLFPRAERRGRSL